MAMGKESGRQVILKIGDGAEPTEAFNTLAGLIPYPLPCCPFLRVVQL